MADIPAKKEDAFETTIVILFGLALLGAVAERLLALIEGGEGLFSTEGGSLLDFLLSNILPVVKMIAFIVSVLALFGIVYSVRKLTKINKELNYFYSPSVPTVSLDIEEEVKNKKWERVLSLLNSDNPNDWKFAIIEADIILNEMLDVMGYRGETMSDKLKNIEESDFLTLNEAWEAHKVRNIIAHEGSDYMISKREADRVIALFKKVFEEFHFI